MSKHQTVSQLTKQIASYDKQIEKLDKEIEEIEKELAVLNAELDSYRVKPKLKKKENITKELPI